MKQKFLIRVKEDGNFKGMYYLEPHKGYTRRKDLACAYTKDEIKHITETYSNWLSGTVLIPIITYTKE